MFSCKEYNFIENDNLEYDNIDIEELSEESARLEEAMNRANLEILTFQNVRAAVDEMYRITNSDFQTQLDLYKASSLQSFFVIAEYHYRIAASQSSFEDLVIYVNQHSDYLILKEDINGELFLETIYEDHPYIFLANKDGMFIAGDSVFRLVSEGLISTSRNNIDEIKTIDLASVVPSQQKEKVIKSGAITVYSFKTDHETSVDPTYSLSDVCTGNNGPTNWSGARTNGNNRHSTTFDLNDIFPGETVEISWEVEVKSHKKTLGAWILASRTTTFDLRYRLDLYYDYYPQYAGPDGWYYPENTDPDVDLPDGVIQLTRNGKFAKRRWNGFAFSSAGQPFYVVTQWHVGGIDIYTDTPSASAYSVECNKHLLY